MHQGSPQHLLCTLTEKYRDFFSTVDIFSTVEYCRHVGNQLPLHSGQAASQRPQALVTPNDTHHH